MKILFVACDVPYPLDSGGKIRAYHLIKQLAQKHEVTLFTYYRDKNQLSYLNELDQYCSKIRAFKRTRVFSGTHIANTLTCPNLSAHISHYYHPELRRELTKELAIEKYQLLHLESFYTSHLLGNYPVKQILGTENIEWKVYAKHANQQALYLKAPLWFEVLRTRWFEEKTWRKADIILAVSDYDADIIKKKTDKQVYIIPNGVDLDFFKFKPRKKIKTQPTILFIGNFAYIQNQDAAKYLISDIFPLIKSRIKEAKLLLVGRNIPKRLLKNRNSYIEFKDDVNDIRKAHLLADVLVSPIRIGSGTHFNILEAMATGVPVVTTNLAIEGMNNTRGKPFMIGNSADEIAHNIQEILTDKELRLRLTNNAFTLIKSKYDWDTIGDSLLRIYGKVMQ